MLAWLLFPILTGPAVGTTSTPQGAGSAEHRPSASQAGQLIFTPR